MPLYRDLDPAEPADRRTVERLLALRRQLDGEGGVPRKTLERTLLIATWNLRDFDSAKFGIRSREAMAYIAEIVSRFDIVALQEVNQDLTGLERLLALLGPWWKHLATDVTEGAAGNHERLVFVYDSRTVHLGGIVAELVLPGEVRQVSRTPYMVGFETGWARFFLTTVHIVWGSAAAEDKVRVAEIAAVARFLEDRAKDAAAWSRNMILVGDFNIFATSDATFRALADHGFAVPPELMGLSSTPGGTRHYDQIAFRVDDSRLTGTGRAGVVDYYRTVFTEADHPGVYGPFLTAEGVPPKDTHAYYLDHWRTQQMSDHLPLWCELRIDYSEEFLERRVAGA